MDSFLTEFISFQPNVMFVFGMFLLMGVLGGTLASRLKWMPTITSFMFIGFMIGPHGLGIIDKTVLGESSVLTDIAIGLILYRLGNMLHPRQMLHSKRLMMMAALETGTTFILTTLLMLALGYDLVFSSIIGAISVSSSPAVLVHVSEELKTKGPVTEHVKSLVAMNNLISFLLFSFVMPAALIKYQSESIDNLILIPFIPFIPLIGAIIIGVLIAWLAIHITKLLHEHDQHYRFAIIVGAVMLTLGTCTMFGISSLLAPLVLGIATRWFESSKHNLTRITLGEGGDIFFIILFVMAGAKIDPSLFLALGLAPILLVLIRSLSKFMGVIAASRHNRFFRPQEKAISLLLIPMAGMAIGLASALNHLDSEIASEIEAIVFSMVAIFETIGPLAAAYAFRLCGEAGKAKPRNDNR